jgi:hypothetical protein
MNFTYINVLFAQAVTQLQMPLQLGETTAKCGSG